MELCNGFYASYVDLYWLLDPSKGEPHHHVKVANMSVRMGTSCGLLHAAAPAAFLADEWCFTWQMTHRRHGALLDGSSVLKQCHPAASCGELVVLVAQASLLG